MDNNRSVVDTLDLIKEKKTRALKLISFDVSQQAGQRNPTNNAGQFKQPNLNDCEITEIIISPNKYKNTTTENIIIRQKEPPIAPSALLEMSAETFLNYTENKSNSKEPK